MSDPSQFDSQSDPSDIRRDYLEAILLIERLHRKFLEVIKTELDNHGIADINNIQALILFNIGDSESVSYTHLPLPTKA